MRKLILLFLLMLFTNFIVSAEDSDLEKLLKSDEKQVEKAMISEAKKEMNTYEAKIEKVFGQVLLKYDKEEIWKQVSLGMAVREGTTIVTTEKSKVSVSLPNGTIVDLKEKTQAVFKNLKQSPEKRELTETNIKLIVGKIFSNVKKMVEVNSKYEIETSSATAGVRGTQFLTESDENGNTTLLVYEGVVNFSTVDNKEGINVEKGEKISANKEGKISEKVKHNESIPIDEEFVNIEEKKQPEIIKENLAKKDNELKEEKKEYIKTEAEEDKDKKEKKDKKKAEESKGSSNEGQATPKIKGTLEAGAETVNGKSYATLQLKPDFENIFGTPIGLGLKVTLLQGNEEGKKESVIKYGPKAGDKWWEAISIRWVEWKGKTLEVRYGEIGPTTYGHGLLMENFDVFGARIKYKNPNFNIGTLASLKEMPLFTFDKKVAARGELKLSMLPWIFSNIWVGGTYITDLDDNIKDLKVNDKKIMPNAGVAGDVFIPISDMFTPYAEYAKLLEFGDGFGTGVRGKLGFFGYKFEYRIIGEEFKPGYYDDYYLTGKDKVLSLVKSGISTTDSAINNTGMPIRNSKSYSGWLGQTSLGFGDIFAIKAVYEDYGDIDANGIGEGKRISIGGKVKWPQPKVEGGIDYKQRNINFDKFKLYAPDDENWKNKSSVNAYIIYPVAPALGLRIDYNKSFGEEFTTGFRTIFIF